MITIRKTHPTHIGRHRCYTCLCFLAILAGMVCFQGCGKSPLAESPRQRENFDFGWRFRLGEVENATAADFDDSAWRDVLLPHDWSIEGEYDEKNPTSWRGAYLPAGIGWYRKTFLLHPSDAGKRLFLEFDGVYMNSDVYLNGHHLGHRPNGYISFQYEITEHVNTNGPNVVAVRVDNSKVPSGRWYTGCGIYRHTWLTKTNSIHVAHNGTYVRTEKVSDSESRVFIEVELVNQSEQSTEVEVSHTIQDKSDRSAGTFSMSAKLAASETRTESASIPVSDPQLWSSDHPHLYKLVTTVRQAGVLVDRYETPFGIRYLEFGPEYGMKLNGER
ncbi:MAG: beta galactosidase jelly roll domain-containing protein, partial [Verrucomicrobiae bacterium]|nr:beta galactosidase jelly roll domain-containing protein [Verrucomicrobiae bacterium]